MTEQELLSWTARLYTIMHGRSDLRDKRLAQLMTDLESAYNIPVFNDNKFNKNNELVIGFYRMVSNLRS